MCLGRLYSDTISEIIIGHGKNNIIYCVYKHGFCLTMTRYSFVSILSVGFRFSTYWFNRDVWYFLPRTTYLSDVLLNDDRRTFVRRVLDLHRVGLFYFIFLFLFFLSVVVFIWILAVSVFFGLTKMYEILTRSRSFGLFTNIENP